MSTIYTDVSFPELISDPRDKRVQKLIRADGTLIVLANFLLEKRHEGTALDNTDFPAWMQQHREIRSVLSRRELD